MLWVTRRIHLKSGHHKVEARAVGHGTLRLGGFILRHRRRGVILHSIGVRGVAIGTLVLGDQKLYLAQLKRLRPSLLVVQLGTNDAYDFKITDARYEKQYRRRLKSLLKQSRRVACLVVGPPDFGDRKFRKARRLRVQARMVRRVQRKVAREIGCAFWDLHAAMGGEGAIRNLARARPRWAYRDRVHLTVRGSRALGALLNDELMRGYADYLRRHPRLRLTPPVRPNQALRDEAEERKAWPRGVGQVRISYPHVRSLDRFYRGLSLIARGVRRARTRIVYLGDSHIANDELTGEVRKRLQQAFGDGGHGFIHAGAPWSGYRHRHVRSGAVGPWQYYYLSTRFQPEQPGDDYFGLGGVSSWITVPVPPPPPPGRATDGGVRDAR